MDLVGAIDGQLDVNAQGDSTYHVEILSAAGTAGVAPHISLNYASNDGDGPLGTGWSIGGLSSITRCRQTPSQDNNSTAITLTASDRFCLDGQRLILTVGNQYGDVGTTYRTEIDSYAVVTASGGSAGNPAYFTVQRKDGSLSFYGNSADSQQSLSGGAASGILVWSINRFQDSVGNAIRFSYLNPVATNEHLISRIDYAYGSDPGTVNNSYTYLQFDYTPRTDNSSGYVAGYEIKRTRLLKTIHSYSSNNELRNYNLIYSQPPTTITQSYLSQIFECVRDSCLSPTTFTWNINQGGLQPAGNQVGTTSNTFLSAASSDINGDGKSDFVYTSVEPITGSILKNYVLNVRLSTGPGLGGVQSVVFGYGPLETPPAMYFLDFNNDGKKDVLVNSLPVFGSNAFVWKLFLGTSSGFVPFNGADGNTGITAYSVSVAAMGDMDGDGLSDLVYTASTPSMRKLIRSNSNGTWAYQFGGEQAFSLNLGGLPTQPAGCGSRTMWGTGLLPSNIGDFNGDGRIDLPIFMLAKTNGIIPCAYYESIFSADSSGTYTPSGWTNLGAQPQTSNSNQNLMIDVNGDGLVDKIELSGNTTWQYRLSNGSGYEAPVVLGSAATLGNFQLADFNGDGYPDLIYPSGSNLAVQLYNPSFNNYAPAAATTIPYQPASTGVLADRDMLADIDGDGHVDLLRIGNNGSSGNTITLYRSADTDGVGNRITHIDNGIGKVSDIYYKPLTDPSVYTLGNDANNATLWSGFPVSDVISSKYVVSTLSSTAPTASSTTPNQVGYTAIHSVNYQYAGAKLQAGGRGNLGFSTVTVKDNQTGIVSISTYRQDFPFVGQLLSVVGKSSNSTSAIIFKSTYRHFSAVPHPGAGVPLTTYYQVYADTETALTRDPVNDAETGFTIVSTAQPDVWGNVTSSTTSNYGFDHYSFITQQRTSNTYGSSDYEQEFGRLSSSIVTYKRAGSPDIVRTKNFTYYGSGDGNKQGLLKSESMSVPDGTATSTATYQYDSFGNKTRITQSAAGLSDRYVNTAYDIKGRFVEGSSSAFFNGTTWVDQQTSAVLSRDSVGYGLPTQIQGLNGFFNAYSYDLLGREIERHDSSGAGVTTTYRAADIPGAKIKITTTASTGATATQYFDVLGRVIKKSHAGFDGAEISTETEYDNAGHVKRESIPHFNSANYWTENTYDNFGRLTQTIKPTVGGGSASAGIAYNGLSVTTTNALNQTNTEKHDASGKLIEVTDALGGIVQYGYAADGQLTQTISFSSQGSAVSSTVLTYDQLGRKIKLVDSDKGTWFYQYTAFSDLLNQYKVMSVANYPDSLALAIANGVPMQRTYMVYDLRGRMKTRVDFRENGAVDAVSSWAYDTATNGIGQLARQSAGGLIQTMSYDSIGRLTATMHQDGSGSYLQAVSYDAVGRPYLQTDALNTGSGTQNSYNSYGYLQSVSDIATGTVLDQVQAMDAWGHITSDTYSNGVSSSWNYDAATGFLLGQISTGGAVTFQNTTYTWDALGNLSSRHDIGGYASAPSRDAQQGFCYDSLNRLIKTNEGSLNSGCGGTQDQQYDSFGNIINKSGVGSYTYSADRPHQLVSTGDGVAYTYDAVGNLLSDSSGRTIHYTAFDKPDTISKGSTQTTFAYGPDRNYYKRTDVSQGKTTYRIGSVEKTINLSGGYDIKRHMGRDALWVHHFNSSGVQTSLEKLQIHRDVLGSVVSLTSESGSVSRLFGYTPWGLGASITDWHTLVSPPLLQTLRSYTIEGFTGQDSLDVLGFIHMGGRIYDPRLARFVQADPIVPSPRNTQAYNRYSYVLNRPLTLTDPSGYDPIPINIPDITIIVTPTPPPPVTIPMNIPTPGDVANHTGGGNTYTTDYLDWLRNRGNHGGGNGATSFRGQSDSNGSSSGSVSRAVFGFDGQSNYWGGENTSAFGMYSLLSYDMTGGKFYENLFDDIAGFGVPHEITDRPIEQALTLEMLPGVGEIPLAFKLGVGLIGRAGVRSLAIEGAESAARETTILFRAVTEGELKQIQATGKFAAGPNSLGGKFFAESAEHAQQWGDAMNGIGKSTVLRVELPAVDANKFMRWDRLDGIGPARYGELDQLINATITGH